MIGSLDKIHHPSSGAPAPSFRQRFTEYRSVDPGSDPYGYNDRERRFIGRAASQLERWNTAVDLAFRRQYAIPIHREIASSHTDPTVIARFSTISQLLNSDLAPIIEDRNKVAHGQWAWHLNSRETGFARHAQAPLNYSALKRRNELIGYISEIIHTLVVSEPTFQRDFAALYTKLQKAKTLIDGSKYPGLERQLRLQASARISAIRNHD
jgi:hypothetical protein